MKNLEQGSKRIQMIGEELKKDIIDPAKKEAEQILEEAQRQAAEIINAAQEEAHRIHQSAKQKIEQEWNVFQSSMALAAKQGIEALKLEIENHLFNKDLHSMFAHHMADPKVVAKLIDAVVKAIEREGLSGNLSVLVPKTVSSEEVNSYLGADLLARLRDKSVLLGGFSGGAQIKLNDKNLTVDVTDHALMELLGSYRKDFRKLFFGSR